MISTIALVIIGLSFGFNCLFAALIVLHRRRIAPGDAPLPRFPKVSIFLTLRNLDDGLEENLASVLSTDYPDFNVLFAIDGLQDPCVPVLERVRAKFPDVKSKVVATGHAAAGNPKIAKLALLEKQSGAALYWVLDSDVRVVPQTLAALVAGHLTHDARLVFSPIRCCGGRTFGSMLEMSHINFFLSGSALTAWRFFGARVVVGKSLLIDRQALARFGGFAFFSDVLAEDHWLGESFHRSGFRVGCNYTWVDNIKESTTVKNFWGRMERWAKIRFNLKPGVYLLELLFNPLALTLLSIPLLKGAVFLVAPAVVLMRILLEYVVFFSVNDSDRRPAAVFAVAPAAVLKDLIMFIVYFIPFFSHSVIWRGGRIRIGKETRIAVAYAPSIAAGSPPRCAEVVAVLMGMGHLRAAYPLRRLGGGSVTIYGSENDTPPAEYRIWRAIRNSYYIVSRAGEAFFIGKLLLRIMLRMQRIEPFYPRRDGSAPNGAVRYVEHLISRRGLCDALVARLRANRGAIIHTYFATALAADRAFGSVRDNYLLICDADFNRVWAPLGPQKSHVRYLVPCSEAKRRLLSYGVPEERIFLTGFPLPKENIGSEIGLEIVKSDLLKRLLRLDPGKRFFRAHRESLVHWFDSSTLPAFPERPFTVTFAIGGAGAQTALAFAALRSLAGAIRQGRIRFIISVGTDKRVLEKTLRHVN